MKRKRGRFVSPKLRKGGFFFFFFCGGLYAADGDGRPGRMDGWNLLMRFSWERDDGWMDR